MTRRRPIRVLLADDSAFARKVVRETLSKAPDIEVVGIARDGLDALEQCSTLAPDVLTLDLMMPELDGLGVLQELAHYPRAPRVVLVSSSAVDSQIAVTALQLGAVALVQKPTALATDRLYELGEDLLEQVRIAGSSAPLPSPPPSPPLVGDERSDARPEVNLIVLGTSTGGPHALTRLLSALPAELPVPVLAVVHIPIGYTATLAERIDRASAIRVVEAEHGLELGPGMAAIARAGLHLHLQRVAPRVARCVLSAEPHGMLHRPAVDVLFTSAAEQFGSGVLGVVLTGMGNDGERGAREIRARGGSILTEETSSCIVDSMPRAVLEAGLSNGQATLEHMAQALLRRL